MSDDVEQMKGGTHLAHKTEHAVDMDSGPVVTVTLQSADLGETTTMQSNAGRSRHGSRGTGWARGRVAP